VLAFVLTQRLCPGLTRREREEAGHGRETGRIVMSPDGGYREIREPVRVPAPALAPREDGATVTGSVGGKATGR
jgi:ubiquinol-cytochrome c reductase cytochrome b subunit